MPLIWVGAHFPTNILKFLIITSSGAMPLFSFLAIGRAYSRARRQNGRARDAQPLLPSGLASEQLDTAACNAKGLGKELGQVGVGPTIDRRSGEPHLEVFPLRSCDLVAAGARLNPDI